MLSPLCLPGLLGSGCFGRNEYGVQIMTPAYEGDTPEPKVVPREKRYAAPAKPAAAD